MRTRNAVWLILSLTIILIIVIVFFAFVVQQDRSSRSSSNNRVSTSATDAAQVHPEETQESAVAPMRAPVPTEICLSLGIACSSDYFQPWQEPAEGSCRAAIQNGYPVPDPRCTPGGINSTLTLNVMQDPGWRTRCLRDCEESLARKHAAYAWYQTPNPQHNSGSNQVCEVDHLVPLELGGADGMGNIWPQCGPDDADLQNRYFKIKDRVENYLADEVMKGRMPLEEAQRGIAFDWTQYLHNANRYCANGGRC